MAQLGGGQLQDLERTASQAALTAPPVIQLWRDADEEPAEPTWVSAGRTTTRSTPSSAGDLGLEGDQALADLGGRGVDLDQRLAGDDRQPDPPSSSRRSPPSSRC